MARPTKAGLDYFELDCQLEEKVRLIQAEFGLKGFAVVVKLYQKIYGELGYYCEWNNDSLLLFMSENGVSSCDEKNLIQEIISACIRRGIFSEKLFNEFGILTSAGVQKRYLNATSRRERVELKKEYLLLSVGKNQKNVVINSINVDRNEVNVCRNSQSRVEKSRVEKSRVYIAERSAEFKKLWELYPRKVGEDKALKHYLKARESGVTFEQIKNGITAYCEYIKQNKIKPQYIKYASTWFENSAWLDEYGDNQSKTKAEAEGEAIRYGGVYIE